MFHIDLLTDVSIIFLCIMIGITTFIIFQEVKNNDFELVKSATPKGLKSLYDSSPIKFIYCYKEYYSRNGFDLIMTLNILSYATAITILISKTSA